MTALVYLIAGAACAGAAAWLYSLEMSGKLDSVQRVVFGVVLWGLTVGLVGPIAIEFWRMAP